MTAPGAPSVVPPPVPPTRSASEYLASWVEHGLTWAGHAAVFLLCRVALVDLAFREVRAKRYLDAKRPPDHALDAGQAEFLFKAQREDSSHTDDKVKQLLTLSSSLATIILAFVRDVRPRWLVVSALALLFACVYLCVSVLDVRGGQGPTPGDAGQDDRDLKRGWARDLVASLYVNQRAHAYRVDRYRAAGRYFRVAFLLTPVLAWRTVPRRDAAAEYAAQRQVAAMQRVGSAVDSLGLRLDAAIRANDCGAVPAARAPRAPAERTATARRPAARHAR